jgi:hypothetical protein
MNFRYTLTVIYAVLLLLTASATVAQPPNELATFRAGGREHTISYPSTAEESPQASAVIQAVRRTLPIYNRLWEIESPEVYVKVLTAADGDTLAEAGREEATVPVPGEDEPVTRDLCVVTVYNNAETRDRAELQFTVAHEIAHCYQGYGMSEFTGYIDGDGWWSEGSAEWLATHVYRASSTSPLLADYQDGFVDNHDTNLIDGETEYDGMYFWHSIESQLGVEGVMAWLKAMPGEAEGYEAHVMALPDSDAVFHEYARQAASGELPYQPDPESLFENVELVRSFPRVAEISTPPFSFDTVTLDLPALEDGQGISLTALYPEDSAMRVSVLGGSLLTDAETVELCEFDAPVRLIVSRTASDSTAPVLITVDETDCDGETTDESEVMPECLIGTWVVTEFPPIPGITDVAIVSGAQVVTIDPDGTVLVTTEDFRIKMVSEVTVELTVDSSFVEFTINSVGPDGSVDVTPGTSNLGTAFVDVNGTVVEIDLNDAAGAVVAPAPIRMECGAGTLFWYFDANGAETSFTLGKLDTP